METAEVDPFLPVVAQGSGYSRHSLNAILLIAVLANARYLGVSIEEVGP